MKLFEHQDFGQAILRVVAHFRDRRLRPSIVEKDYFVTESLRAIATTAGDKVIFKGGTSLAKGWNLIQRFSEDIDIFLDSLAFSPPLSKRAIDRELKKLRDAVGAHPALSFVENESQTIGGFGRNDRFSYVQRFGGPGEVANRVLLEAGTASGREPTTIVDLLSYVGQYLRDSGLTLGQRMKAGSRCACFTFGEHSSRRCSPSTARWNCSSETGSPSERTPGTTTTCFNWRRKRCDRDAEVRRVRSHPGGLRPDQPDPFFEELFPS